MSRLSGHGVADIITKDVYNILEPALKRRDAVAPRTAFRSKELQVVDAFNDDLITNAILKIV